MLEEPRYLHLVDAAFKKMLDAFEAVDPDDADAYAAGDVLTITFRDRSKCVINTQRPTRQIWLAARARAWHFAWDEPTGRWLDDRGRGDELFATLRAIVQDSAGVALSLA
jgi:CyaY protein